MSDDSEQWLGPTHERLRHAEGDHEEFIADSNRRTFRMTDTPLAKLLFKKRITGDQFQAGARYYEDAFHGGLMSSGVVDTSKERVDGGHHRDISDMRIAALTRHHHALRALDSRSVGVLSTVVLSEHPLANYAQRMTGAHPYRRLKAATSHLCAALDALDRHYNPPRRDRGIVASVGERPIIMPAPLDVGS